MSFPTASTPTNTPRLADQACLRHQNMGAFSTPRLDLPILTRMHGSVNWRLHCSCKVHWSFMEPDPHAHWSTPGFLVDSPMTKIQMMRSYWINVLRHTFPLLLSSLHEFPRLSLHCRSCHSWVSSSIWSSKGTSTCHFWCQFLHCSRNWNCDFESPLILCIYRNGDWNSKNGGQTLSKSLCSCKCMYLAMLQADVNFNVNILDSFSCA